MNKEMVSKDKIKKLIQLGFPFSGNPEELTLTDMLNALQFGKLRAGTRVVVPENFNNPMIIDTRKSSRQKGYVLRRIETTNIPLLEAYADTIIWLKENNLIVF